MTPALLLGAALFSAPQAGGSVRPLAFVKPLLLPGHRFIVCAHRGDHTLAPENTLDSLEEAVKSGADYVECDIRTSRDGRLFILHDSTLDRTTSGKGKADRLDLADLKKLEIRKARRPGETIPTFDELLKAAKGRIRIYMDVKDAEPRQILPLLRRHGMMKGVIAYLYGPEQRAQWRREAPEIPIISDLDQMKDSSQIEKDWKASPLAITDGSARGYTKAIVDAWHKLGVAVVPDIQNPGESPAQWTPYIEMGVDGFQTDHPKALVDCLKSMGIR